MATTELTSIYFTEVNVSGQILERVYFDNAPHMAEGHHRHVYDYGGRPSRDVHYFLPLVFQVLAVALLLLPAGTSV
jgi:hypothetical protein